MLAFIPARGGSKGIPRKNLVPLAGRPLIDYTLEAARASRTIDEIFVSTDDEEIAHFCERRGVPVPYRRPAALATDTASMRDAVLDALRWISVTRAAVHEELVLLHPTSPLRTADDIDRAVALFRANSTNTAFSVHRMVEHPWECIRTGGDGWQYVVEPGPGVVRRQDYPNEFYFINGAIYLVRTQHLLAGGSFIVPGESALYEMPPQRGIDIDAPFQLVLAEALMIAGASRW